MKFRRFGENKVTMTRIPIRDLAVGIKGGGEMASAVAWRLHMANIRNIFMMETAHPLAVRRKVSFCEAIYDGKQIVEGVTGTRVGGVKEIETAWSKGEIAVLADPEWKSLGKIRPDVSIDAILAKRNMGTNRSEAPLVIGIGPGFVAGKDAHMVVESNRGHNLGKIIVSGSAEPNTGIPGNIGGFAQERVLRSPGAGEFETIRAIGDIVQSGDLVGAVGGIDIHTKIGGIIRGLIRNRTMVKKNLKLGDIDPRNAPDFCHTISDKARAISGSVLEAILRIYNA